MGRWQQISVSLHQLSCAPTCTRRSLHQSVLPRIRQHPFAKVLLIRSGPVSEFSQLGQFLKDVDNLNLDSNRWASLLPAEKTALSEVAGPIGIAFGDHDWDFGFRYLWAAVEMSDETHLTAEREVSYRHWSAGAQVQGFKIRIPFSMPHRGDFAAEIVVGRDGDHMIGRTLCSAQSCSELGWAERFRFLNAGRGVCGESDGGWACTAGTWDHAVSVCTSVGARLCSIEEFGNYPGGTGCGFDNSHVWAEDACTAGRMVSIGGRLTTDGECQDFDQVANVRCCGDDDTAADECLSESTGSSVRSSGTSDVLQACWNTLPNLVPLAHSISDGDATVSSQGAEYFEERFCPGFRKFVSPNTCSDSEPNCGTGNAVFDGGDDMCECRGFVILAFDHRCFVYFIRSRGLVCR